MKSINNDSCNKELQKTKIDILRDAIQDAAATIRALDRKIAFLVSYNVFFLTVISTIFYKHKEIIESNMISEPAIFYFFLFFIFILWIINIAYTVTILSPANNPNEIFDKESQSFGENMFYIVTEKNTPDIYIWDPPLRWLITFIKKPIIFLINFVKIKPIKKEKIQLNLNQLVNNYKKLKTNTSLEKLLFKELGKVSYIRNNKINNIKTATTFTFILTFLFLFLLAIFFYITIEPVQSLWVQDNKKQTPTIDNNLTTPTNKKNQYITIKNVLLISDNNVSIAKYFDSYNAMPTKDTNTTYFEENTSTSMEQNTSTYKSYNNKQGDHNGTK